MSILKTKVLKWQAEALQDDSQYLCILGGLGSAKTRFIAQFLVEECRLYPGARCLLAAQTYPLLMEAAFFELKKYLAELSIAYKWNENRKILTFSNNSIIKLQTLDVNEDELRGPEWSCIVVDEAAQIKESTYTTLIDRARYKIGSRKIRILSNSKDVSPAHWIAKFYQTNPRANHKLKTVTTYMNRKNLPPDYIPNLERRYPPGSQLHKRWMLGEIIGMEGVIYPEFNQSFIFKDIPKFVAELSGVDWGVHDPFVILNAGIDYKGNLYIYDEFYQAELAPSQYYPELERRCRNGPVFIDHSAREMAEMTMRNFNVHYAEKEVLTGIEVVRNRFTSKSVFIHESCVNTINSLYQYAWSTGTKEKPEHKFSHAPDALRYLIMGVDDPAITPAQAARAASCFTF